MRSLFCVFVTCWIGLVLSFRLAPLHQSQRRQIYTPITVSSFQAKFQATVAPKFQPTVCFSSTGRSSSWLKSLVKNRVSSGSSVLPVPDASLKVDKHEDATFNHNAESTPGMTQKEKIKKSFLISPSPRGSQNAHEKLEPTEEVLKRNTAFTDKKAAGKWSDSETTKLRELVTKQLQPVWSDAAGAMVTPTRMDWVSIAKEVAHSSTNCRNKWFAMKHEKQGSFSAEEDALILQRVEEWGDMGRGLWTAMSKEMQRSLTSLKRRWSILHNGKLERVFWSKEMQAALVNAYEKEKKIPNKHNGIPLWERVSISLKEQGWVVSPAQCLSRYDRRT